MYTVLLATILLLIIIIICYHYTEKVQYKIKNNELKKVHIKNRTCYFDLDDILKDEKLHENILIYDILYKTLIG